MRTHPLNVTNLVVGLIFLGLAGSWALQATDVVDLGGLQWLLPLTLVVAGVVGLVAFATKRLRPQQSRPAAGYDEPADEPDDYSPDYTSDIEEKLR